MKKFRGSQTSILMNSCSELSKPQFFPVSIVKDGWVLLVYVGNK